MQDCNHVVLWSVYFCRLHSASEMIDKCDRGFSITYVKLISQEELVPIFWNLFSRFTRTLVFPMWRELQEFFKHTRVVPIFILSHEVCRFYRVSRIFLVVDLLQHRLPSPLIWKLAQSIVKYNLGISQRGEFTTVRIYLGPVSRWWQRGDICGGVREKEGEYQCYFQRCSISIIGLYLHGGTSQP